MIALAEQCRNDILSITFFFGWAMQHAGSLFLNQGFNLHPPEAWGLNHWGTREVPIHPVLDAPSSEVSEAASAIFHTWFDPVFLE